MNSSPRVQLDLRHKINRAPLDYYWSFCYFQKAVERAILQTPLLRKHLPMACSRTLKGYLPSPSRPTSRSDPGVGCPAGRSLLLWLARGSWAVWPHRFDSGAPGSSWLNSAIAPGRREGKKKKSNHLQKPDESGDERCRESRNSSWLSQNKTSRKKMCFP